MNLSADVRARIAEHERSLAAVLAGITPEERAAARARLEAERVRERIAALADHLEFHRSGHTHHLPGCGFPELVCDCREEERDCLEDALARYQDELVRIERAA